MTTSEPPSVYPYQPSIALPAVFAAICGLSCLIHIWQNFRYHMWRTMYFMAWGGAIFTAGWVVRAVSASSAANLANTDMYLAMTVFIYAGPPIYAAAEYHVLGRMMLYLPMHPPFNPNRTVLFFIYLGALVESTAAAGAALIGGAVSDIEAKADVYKTGTTLVSVSLVLQAAVEVSFMSTVVMLHRRVSRAKMMTPNVLRLCIMLYGTSAFVLIRCLARAIDDFSTIDIFNCDSKLCSAVTFHEWYLFAFEAAPMAIYTIWLNINHPGRLLPRNKNQYLDVDGRTERVGPGWIERNRSRIDTFWDPCNLAGVFDKRRKHDKFWERPDEWPVAEGGSFAEGTATNVDRKAAKGGVSKV